MRETKYKAIILKKQQIGEGDEIVTLYTKELGKIRVLGKSTKLAKSKLQHALQALFCVEVALAGHSSFPKIIGAEVANTFSGLKNNLEASKHAWYALELVLKFTPDEQTNEGLFLLLLSYLEFLNQERAADIFAAGLCKFKIEFLNSVGFGLQAESNATGFSTSRGGFVTTRDSVDYKPVSQHALQHFEKLQQSNFEEVSHYESEEKRTVGLSELQELLSGFLSYQLEREIMSEQLLRL